MGLKGNVPDVLQLCNLLRMGVLWVVCLIYSHLSYLVLRLQSKPEELKALYFCLCSSPHCKPASIVTWASSGYGWAAAMALAQRGFHVILVGRSLERLEVVRGEIQGGCSSTSGQALALDLCFVPSILSFVQTVRDLFEAHDAPGILQLLREQWILAASQRWTEDGVDVTTAKQLHGILYSNT